jgi:hypothetical protein
LRIKRRGQAILAIHDLGEEIALHAVEAAVDLRLHVAMGGDDMAVLHADHHAAAGAAEAAGRLRPFDLQRLDAAGNGLGGRGQRDARRSRRERRRMRLQEIAAVDGCLHVSTSSPSSMCSKTMLADMTPSIAEMPVSVSPSMPLVGPSIVIDPAVHDDGGEKPADLLLFVKWRDRP